MKEYLKYAEYANEAYDDDGPNLIVLRELGIEYTMTIKDNEVIFAFRGTDPNWKDIKTDLKGCPKFTRRGLVHRGVYKRAKKIWAVIEGGIAIWKAKGYTVVFCGHSLGAMTAEILAEFFYNEARVYAYAPGACMRLWGASKVAKRVWFSNGDDPLPQLKFFGVYKHYGVHIHLGPKPTGSVFDKGVLDHSMKKYLKALV